MHQTPTSAESILKHRATQVEAVMRGWFDAAASPGGAAAADVAIPATLLKAMRYSLEAGGKRLRPALVLECCEACGGPSLRDLGRATTAPLPAAIAAALAVECVHTFSLIHDDLPAMDDDDLRRGRPTNHKVFGEANAILAGDALLTVAFEILTVSDAPADRALAMVRTLADGTGWRGMIAGQVLDLEGESHPADLSEVRRIHRLKTAALIATSCRLGGLAAGADAAALSALTDYGMHLGEAFQAVDDLLDVTQTSAVLGKTAGKDQAAGKQSLAVAVDVDTGWRLAAERVEAAIAAAAAFADKAAPLQSLARFVLDRRC